MSSVTNHIKNKIKKALYCKSTKGSTNVFFIKRMIPKLNVHHFSHIQNVVNHIAKNVIAATLKLKFHSCFYPGLQIQCIIWFQKPQDQVCKRLLNNQTQFKCAGSTMLIVGLQCPLLVSYISLIDYILGKGEKRITQILRLKVQLLQIPLATYQGFKFIS